MQYLLDTYEAAQNGFEAKPADPKSDKVTYGAQGAFYRAFSSAAALLARQKQQTQKRSHRILIQQNTEHLSAITALFLKRLPVYPWDAIDLEGVFANKAFNPAQKKALTNAFEYALVRDVKADPKCIEYRFINSHQFMRGGKAMDVFTKVLTHNFKAMYGKNPRLTMLYAARMSGLANKASERQRFIDLLASYAPKYNQSYQRIDGEGGLNDPFMTFAMVQAGTKHQAKALQLLQDRITRLSIKGRAHKQHRYSPHVMVIPSEDDDLHFDAFDAILDLAFAANHARKGNRAFLQAAQQAFATHFDALVELNAPKAFNFATTLHGRISYFRDGSPIQKEAHKFQNNIIGLIATTVLGKVDRVEHMLGSVSVVQSIMYMSDDKKVRDLVIDYSIEKARKSKKYTADIGNDLLHICKQVGAQHPKFQQMADLICANEIRNDGKIQDASLERLLSLGGLMDGKYNRRLKVLRTAATLAESQGQINPSNAEKSLRNIIKLCQTPTEQKLADNIATHILPTIGSPKPMLDKDAAKMKAVLTKYCI